MFGHYRDDPVAGPDSSSRHAFPRRRTRTVRDGGRRVVQVDSQGALTAVGSHWRVPSNLVQIPEHLRLAYASSGTAQLRARETQGLHREHGRAVADPAEQHPLYLPPGRHVRGDDDHGKIGAVMPVRIGPPPLRRHFDLGLLADVQPYSHRRGSG